MKTLLFIAIAAALFAGSIVLQIYFSRMESRWPGLILPILSFVLSVVLSLGLAVYSVSTRTEYFSYSPDPSVGAETGEVIQEVTPVELPGATGDIMVMAVPLFLLANIPTLIYVAIYCGERGKYRRRRQVEHMNIQDLG